MKTKFKRIGKQSLSIVLAVMMMVSTMLVGAITSNAADNWYVIGHDYGNTWNASYKQYPMSYDSATGYYYIDTTLSTTEGSHYFRLHNGSNEYGPESTSGDITISSYDSKYTVVQDHVSGAFKYACNTTNYRLWLDASSKQIWITDNNAQTTNHTLTLTSDSGVDSVVLDGSTALSSGANTVSNDEHTLKVNVKSGYQIKSVNISNVSNSDTSGTYTLSATSNDVTITITTEATSAPVAGNYIYFANPVSSSATYYLATVNAYMWTSGKGNNANWPGVQINTDKNLIETDYVINNVKYNVYKISIENDSAVFENVIFNSGNNTTQSVDTSIENGALYYISGMSDGKYTLTEKEGYQEPVAKHSVKLTADSSANATVTVDNSKLPVDVAENATYSLTVKPNENYYIKKITVGGEDKFTQTDDNYTQSKSAITISDLTMGTADVEVNVEAAEIVKPVIDSINVANEIYFGNSISISATDNTGSLPDGVTVKSNGFTVSPESAAVADGTFSVPKELGETNTSIKYTVTYTVTLSNGETATATKTITAKDSEEQTAYKALESGLGSTYTAPDKLQNGKYTTATLNAYKTAYEAAQAAVNDGYPNHDGTANQTAKAALDAAKEGLTELTVLERPVLSIKGNSTNVSYDSMVEFYVSNETNYPDTASYTLRVKVGNSDTQVTTFKKGKTAQIPVNTYGTGEVKFYVVASTGDSDNYTFNNSVSSDLTINVVEMVKVSVTAGDNGSAYISSYVDINGETQSNTDTTLTSTTVKKGTNVTFTAVPDADTSVNKWNGEDSRSTTYTVENVTTETNVTVTFIKKLSTPVLSPETQNVAFGTPATLSVNNDGYPDTTTYDVVDASTNKTVKTFGINETISLTDLTVGEHRYYVIASSNDVDVSYFPESKSNTVTINVVETVTVSVTTADTNGSAYISSYYDVDGKNQTGNATLKTVDVKKGTYVTFTAVPNSGYVVASWDGVASSDTKKTITANAATTTTVAFTEKPKNSYSLGGKLSTINGKAVDSTNGSTTFNEDYAFANNTVYFTAGDDKHNFFYVVDSDGNYYSYWNNTTFTYADVSSMSSFTLKKCDKPQSGNAYVPANSSWILNITPSEDGETLTASLVSPWRIYGGSDYFSGCGSWNTPASGYLITSSYNGNANQYYYPVEVTDTTKNIYFGLYYDSKKHQPTANVILTENKHRTGINYYTDGTAAFEIVPDSTGVYYICVDTKANELWYEKAQTEPVPVSLNADLPEGGAAYITSYTDNETGKLVTDETGEQNLQSVNAKPNTSVTFKAKEVEGYYPMWNLNGTYTTGDTYTLNASAVTGTTAVTVYLTYVKIENHKLTITSGEGGSVSYNYDSTAGVVAAGTTSSAITVASNKTIKLTANPDTANSYVFKGWEFDSDNFSYVTGNAASASITIQTMGDVNATATFEENPGELTNYKFNMSTGDNALAYDNTGSTATSYPVYRQADGTYSVTLPASEFKSSSNYYVSFSTDGTSNGLIPGKDSSVNGAVDSSFTNYAKYVGKQEIQGIWYYPSFSFQNREDITSVKFIYNPTTKTYTVTGSYYTAPADAHTVYATKGSAVGFQYGTTTASLFGDGKIYKSYNRGSYSEYVIGNNNQITVECKMNSTEANLGYYVYAFVVNGAKVDVVDNGNNVYQTAAPITVTEDLEITPIYYNKQIEADGNYVTVYVNAPAELQNSWGNSISAYNWYDNSGAEMNGAYPGQLMMRDSQGKFAAKVPKYAYSKDSTGKYVPNTTQRVLGITANNYKENQTVHPKFLTTDEQKKNHQTYDYDDFEKLTGLGYDTVQFDVKYFPTATTSNQEILVGKTTTDHPSKEGTTIPSTTATEYQDLTNIDGKRVSILGYTNETAKAYNKVGLITSEPLQIISVGNQNVSIGSKVNNKWSTVWYVYDSDGNYVTQGLPSDFIPRGEIVDDKFVESDDQTDAYKAIKANGLEYNSAVISYEKELDATTSTETKNTGWRIDGRWYYARSTDQVNVELGIIYRQKDADAWTVDQKTDEIFGKVTGGSSSFDYTDTVGSTYTNLASASVERNTIITMNATNGSSYKFVGWYIANYDQDGKLTGYTELGMTDLTSPYTVTTEAKIFAAYEPYATGSVTITHTKYTGADSHNGLGIFSVTAKEVDANGNLVNSQAIATQSDSNTVTLENIINRNDNSYIEVTLYTQSYAKSHFLNFYYPSVAGGVSTLTKDGNIAEYYDKECTADNRATKTFRVKVSDLFDGDTQKVMALNYYSDLKLPDVDSNITFNYNPYSTAPNPNPAASKGSGKTTFTITIKDKDGNVVYTSAENISSLTLKANDNIKSIVEDYVANGNDYTITITMNPVADNHCSVGQSYYQKNDSGTYTYQQVNTTVDIKLSELYDVANNKFYTNTVNFYTDFDADVFKYNVTFEYLGYESRQYYNTNGFTQEQIPESAIDQNWWKTYTVSGTFYGSDIDKYFDEVDGAYKFKESFLLKVAPYEDNFVQSITWDLNNVVYSTTNSMLSVTATVPAKYDNGFVTVTADLGDGKPKQTYSVNYASLVTPKNLVGLTTQSDNDDDYLIVAPETNANGEKFSYWTIQTDNSDGVEVAKCYTKEFNFLAYDNYLITACYGKDVDSSKLGVSATMQFLEYSRNQYDTGKDKVYADFAVSYSYNGKKLSANLNNDVVCGVVFVVNSKYSSAADATEPFTVDETELLNKVKSINGGSSDKTLGDAKVYNYKLNKANLDNKNRLEYSWNVNNTENNQNLTILAYSYIYNSTTDEYSVSAPQEFKFFNVGNKTYEG